MEFRNTIQLIFTALGGWLDYFLGGYDGLIIALLIFVVVDYITGVMCAIVDKKLSSEIGFKGICRKMLIFLLLENRPCRFAVTPAVQAAPKPGQRRILPPHGIPDRVCAGNRDTRATTR